MRKRQFVVLGLMLLAAAMTMTSCVDLLKTRTTFGGKIVSEMRGLKGFEEVEINGSPTVYYTQADSFSVKVKGPEDLVKNIITEREGNSLVIRNKGKIGLINVQLRDEDELAVYVSSPDLTSVRLNGSGDFISRQGIDTDNMEVTLRGSGDIDMKNVICDRCHVELVGSGDIDVSRLEAKAVSVVLVGSGDVELGLQKVDSTSLALRGSGDIEADFREDCGAVDCELRGSGDITLKGSVRKFDSHKYGSGDIHVDRLNVK